MKILSVEYGIFPEVKLLNHNFSENSNKLCIVIDTESENSLVKTTSKLNLEIFYPYFSTLEHHSCGHCVSKISNPNDFLHQPSNGILLVDDQIDIPHVMEHMILDLLFQLGKPEQLSGVTHQVKDQKKHFVTYIECDNMQKGIFSINVVLAVMHQALYFGRIDPRYIDMIKLAKWLTIYGFSDESIREFKNEFKIDNSILLFCINSLNVFHFADQKITFDTDIKLTDLGPILVIEDNDIMRETLAENLNELGFETIAVPDGMTGVESLKDYKAAVAIIDVYLPDIDGITIAQWILECQPSVSIILTSGMISISDGQTINNGTIKYLPKPFKIQHLTNVLRSI